MFEDAFAPGQTHPHSTEADSKTAGDLAIAHPSRASAKDKPQFLRETLDGLIEAREENHQGKGPITGPQLPRQAPRIPRPVIQARQTLVAGPPQPFPPTIDGNPSGDLMDPPHTQLADVPSTPSHPCAHECFLSNVLHLVPLLHKGPQTPQDPPPQLRPARNLRRTFPHFPLHPIAGSFFRPGDSSSARGRSPPR